VQQREYRLRELNVMYLRVCFRVVAVAAGAVVCMCLHMTCCKQLHDMMTFHGDQSYVY
jgi:hypothetical protein